MFTNKSNITSLRCKMGKVNFTLFSSHGIKLNSKLNYVLGKTLTKPWQLAEYIPFLDKIKPIIEIDKRNFCQEVVNVFEDLTGKSVKEVLSNGLLNQFNYDIHIDVSTLLPVVNIKIKYDQVSEYNNEWYCVLTKAPFSIEINPNWCASVPLSNVSISVDRRIRDSFLTRTDFKNFKDLGKKSNLANPLIADFVGTRKDLNQFYQRLEKRLNETDWLSRVHCYMNPVTLNFLHDITDLKNLKLSVNIVVEDKNVISIQALFD